MKKNYFKKSLSLMLTVLMLMSCWVFVPGEHQIEASAAGIAPETLASTNNAALATLTGSTDINTTSGVYFAGDTDAGITSVPNVYQNLLWSGSAQQAAIITNQTIQDSKDVEQFAIYYPASVLMYDGATTPQMGVSILKDSLNKSDSKYQLFHYGTEISDPTALKIPGDWHTKNEETGSSNPKFYYTWNGGNTQAGLNYTGTRGNSYYAGGVGWHYISNLIQFTGSLDDNTYSATYKPTFKTYLGRQWTQLFSTKYKEATYTLSCSVPIYVINAKPLKAAYTKALEMYTSISDDPSGYTSDSVAAFVTVAQGLLNANPNKYDWGTNTATQVSNYATNAKKAVDAWNDWVKGGGLVKAYTIDWQNEDGTSIYKECVAEGQTPSFSGTKPTKAPTNEYTYEFEDWYPTEYAADKNQAYKATFKQHDRMYKITFNYFDADGNPVTKTEEYKYNAPVSAPYVPDRLGFTFVSWDSEITAVTGDKTYTAQYENTYTVTFKNWNGDIIDTQTVKKGEAATEPQVKPKHAPDADNEYVFAGWLGDYSNVTSDLVITAKYTTQDHSGITETQGKGPTCTTPGQIMKYCSCGYKWNNGEFMDDPARPALGHSFERSPATSILVSNGAKTETTHTVKCTTCTVTTTVPHEFKPDASKPIKTATCKIPGETYEKCACGWEKTIVGDVDPTNHVKTTLTGYVAPTCNAPGNTGTETCDACGTTIKANETIPALGHSYTNYVSDGNATCTADGTKTATCDNGCGSKDTVADPGSMIPHKYTNYVYNEGTAKCEVNGTETAACDYGCGVGTHTREAVGTALEHDYTGAHKSNNNGTHSFLCNNGCGKYGGTVDCGYGDWVDVDANGHKHTCTTCGYTPDATAHVWGEWTTVDGSSDSSAARQTRSCTLCGRVDEIDCTYTSVYTDATCEKDAYTTYTCSDCGHGYTVIHAGTATGHKFDGAYKYDAENDKHQQACTNKGCSAYGVGTTKNDWADCSWTYANAGAGKHTATCVCGNSEEQACSGGQATCTAKAVCQFCNTAYGETTPHSYTGTVIKLDGDNHAYLCVYCNDSTHHGVGADKDATEACYGGSATCKDLAVCEKCSDTYGSYAAHTFNGDAVKLDGDVHAYRCSVCTNSTIYGVGNEENATEACSGGSATCVNKAVCDICKDTHGSLADHTFNGDAVKLDGDVHAYRCSVCKNENLYGVGNEVNKTEACSGGSATCTALAVCDICRDTHGELDANAHDWSEWANVENTETHSRHCKYNNNHTEVQDCFSSSPAVASPDCNTQGYTLNTCDDCSHTWKTDFVDPLGHEWGAWVSNEDGTHTRTCTRACGYDDNTQTEDCTKEEATYVVTAPTCTTKGYTTYTCNDCAYTWDDDYVAELGHDYTEKIVDNAHFIAAATCEAPATYWYDCSRCDKNAKDETDTEKYTDRTFYNGAIRAHAFVNKIDAKYIAEKATCFAGAKYYTSCKYDNCGKSSEEVYGAGKGTKFSDPSSRLEHNWTETETYKATDATCAKDATYYYECSLCGNSSKDYNNGATWTKTDSKTGHEMTHKEAKAATCTEAGNLEYWYCSVCKKYYKDADGNAAYLGESEVVIKKLGHDYDYRAYKAPTCEEAGHSAYSECKNCGKAEPGYTNEVYPATGHKFTGKLVADEENLYHSRLCRNGCGKSGIGTEVYSAVIVDGVLEVTGGEKCTFTYTTETINGVHKHYNTCVCGNGTVTTVEGTKVETVAPTCTEDGYTKYACSDENCTDTWIGDVVKAEGHTLDGEAVSNGNGTHSIKCSACGYQNSTEKCYGGTSTCGTLAVCVVCKGTYGEKGICEYDDNAWEVVSAEKCGVNRVEKNKCINCGTEVTREVEGTALKHDMSGFVVTTPGTCSDRSVLTNSCQREGCDYKETKRGDKDPTNHLDGIDESVFETVGNCATGVTRIYTCKYCGGKDLRPVASAHTYKEYARVYGACEASGYVTLKCGQCNQKVTVNETYAGFGGTVTVPGYTDANGELIGIDTSVLAETGHTLGELVITKDATCSKVGRGYRVCEDCKTTVEADPNTTEELKVKDHDLRLVKGYAATCTTAGRLDYYECYRCGYSQNADNSYVDPAKGHSDSNADGQCDVCGKDLGSPASKCNCACHKEGAFSKFIYKILRFFWKLFGMNKSCACGNVHY